MNDAREISLGSGRAAMVAVTAINLAPRTARSSALIDKFGRWLNGPATPTQTVVSAHPSAFIGKQVQQQHRPGYVPLHRKEQYRRRRADNEGSQRTSRSFRAWRRARRRK